MKKPDRFEQLVRLSGFVSCTLLGFCIASALWDYPGAKDKWSDYLGAVATLIGAFAALIAAGIAYAAIMQQIEGADVAAQKQIEASQNEAIENRERQLRAERHINVVTISEIHKILESNFRIMHDIFKESHDEIDFPAGRVVENMTYISYSRLERLKRIVELSDKDVGIDFTTLFQEIQVLESRIFSERMYSSSHSALEHMTNILEVITLVECFYDYLRGEAKSVDKANYGANLGSRARFILPSHRVHPLLRDFLRRRDGSRG